MVQIAVLDYGIGNLRSAQKALENVGANAKLTSDPSTVLSSDGVVLPGVGNFGKCAAALVSTGVRDLSLQAISQGIPFLGICVGMQLLFESSEESPEVEGLGVLAGEVKLLSGSIKLPQMQWNSLNVEEETPLLTGLQGKWFYFVHSYAVDPKTTENIVVGTCDYGGRVPAVVQKERVFATQFHPEKSSEAGREFLRNFLTYCEAKK
tara:strand:- start:27 stop:647 length:621 start_codon:yes stop_codon:yes gene_type:complete